MALELQRIDPYNESGTTIYYGYATAGTQDSEPLWSIKRKIIVDNVAKFEYPYISGTTMANTYPAISANGVINMQLSGLIWNNRTGYTYR
jgi:hypothetical protein